MEKVHHFENEKDLRISFINVFKMYETYFRSPGHHNATIENIWSDVLTLYLPMDKGCNFVKKTISTR